VVRDEQKAVYDSEICESYLEAESYIDFTLWLTGSRGIVAAAQVAAEIVPLEGYAVMCGRVRVIFAMARQFRSRGVPRERITTEEFEFR
jgi:ferredoxin-NADP reductase